MSFRDEVREAVDESSLAGKVEALSEKIARLEAALAQRGGAGPRERPIAVKVSTAAELLDQTAETIRAWCVSRWIRANKAPGGKEWLIPYSEVERVGGILAAGDEAGAANDKREVRAAADAQVDRAITRLRGGGGKHG